MNFRLFMPRENKSMDSNNTDKATQYSCPLLVRDILVAIVLHTSSFKNKVSCKYLGKLEADK